MNGRRATVGNFLPGACRIAGGATDSRPVAVVDERDRPGELGSDLVDSVARAGRAPLWIKHVCADFVDRVREADPSGALIHVGTSFGGAARAMRRLRDALPDLPVAPYTGSPAGPDPDVVRHLDADAVLYAERFRHDVRGLLTAMDAVAAGWQELRGSAAAFPGTSLALDPDPVRLDAFMGGLREAYVLHSRHHRSFEAMATWLGYDETTLRGWFEPGGKDQCYDWTHRDPEAAGDVLRFGSAPRGDPYLLVVDLRTQVRHADLQALAERERIPVLLLRRPLDVHWTLRWGRPLALVAHLGGAGSSAFGVSACVGAGLEYPSLPRLLWTDARDGGTAEPIGVLRLRHVVTFGDPLATGLLSPLVALGKRVLEWHRVMEPLRSGTPSPDAMKTKPEVTVRARLEQVEGALLARARSLHPSKTASAHALGLTRRALDRRLEKHRLE